MRTTIFLSLLAAATTLNGSATAFSLSMNADNNNNSNKNKNAAATTGRRAFLSKTVATTAGAVLTVSGVIVSPQSALAASATATATPEVKKTASGRIKYAVLKEAKEKNNPPQKGDLVAIEYTGYLTNGKIFDGTHAEGKKNILLFEVGGNAVIDGVNEMLMEMGVGEKVQAIIPAELAFKDKGICLENGECLIKPGESLVYDIALKRSAIPPP